MKKSILSLIAIFFSVGLYAQNPPKLPKQVTDLVGTWSVVISEKNPQGQWVKNKPSTASFKQVLDNFIIEEITHISQNGVVNMQITYGVDTRTKEFRVFTIDKQYGVMDLYKGELKDDHIIVNNLEDEGFTLESGHIMHFQLDLDLSKQNKMLLDVKYTLDTGKSWQDFQKIDYTRG